MNCERTQAKNLQAKWARDSYARHAAEICARKKAVRDAKREADIIAGIPRPGRGRPRIVPEPQATSKNSILQEVKE